MIMAKKQSHRARGRKPTPALTPVSHQPGKGLMISTKGRCPHGVEEKLVCAKSVVQAVRAAHDTQALDGENYDLSWPLSLAITLLEQVSEELSNARDQEMRS
jgi:hypothetical protein